MAEQQIYPKVSDKIYQGVHTCIDVKVDIPIHTYIQANRKKPHCIFRRRTVLKHLEHMQVSNTNLRGGERPHFFLFHRSLSQKPVTNYMVTCNMYMVAKMRTCKMP